MDLNLKKDYDFWHKKNFKEKPETVLWGTKVLYREIISNFVRLSKKSVVGLKILDIACGVGNFLKEAQEKEMKISGIDISREALSKAEKKLEVKIDWGKSERLPYKSNSFDFVTCIGSLEHFNNPRRALEEANRVLKSDGIIYFHVPNLMFIGFILMALFKGAMPSEGGQEFSENYYTYLGWKELLEKCGNFKIIKSGPYNEMFAARKVNKLIRFLWQVLIKHFVPFNLSYAFNFYCKKYEK